VIARHFPDRANDAFDAMRIGGTPASRDAGAALILVGRKTLTSSPVWEWAGTRPPFTGALSVLYDGQDRPRAILETTDVFRQPFGATTEAHARDYGEGDGTLAWFQREMGAYYAAMSAEAGHPFGPETEMVFERLRVALRLSA